MSGTPKIRVGDEWVEPETESERWYARMQRNHPAIVGAPPFWEMYCIVNGAPERLGIERTWPDDLHPADVLDKHIFPQLEGP